MTQGTRETVFLTGMQRSGTTLLQKLLDQQSRVSLLSQPFPLLFVDAKREFLRSIGHHDEPYPLGHLFRERRYARADFVAFLRGWSPGPARVRSLFDEMRDFSGQYTRFPDSVLTSAIDALGAGDFADTIALLYQHLSPEPGAFLYGGKETICEEFFPYLLERGFHCVLILRDPRDTIASLNCGRGPDHGGSIKPTLLNIRNWRKSVAFALDLDRHPRFASVRYEDLVHDPEACLTRISEKLGFPTGPVDHDRIVDASGEVWRGNSSHAVHEGISTGSVGTGTKLLPGPVARFIEATCLPELRLLGYTCTSSVSEAVDVIRRFEEPWEITRRALDTDRMSPESAEVECSRLEQLQQEWREELREWTISEEVHRRLRETLS